jgi:hypothetical protein
MVHGPWRALAAALTLAALASPARAEAPPAPPAPEPAPPPRLNPQIADVFNKLNGEGAFAKVVPAGWKVDHFDAAADSAELTFTDAGGQPHTVKLLLDPPAQGAADGRGHAFYYKFVAGATTPGDASALVKAADLIDAATPAGALQAERRVRPVLPPPPPGPDQLWVPPKNYSTLGRRLHIDALPHWAILGIVLAVLLMLAAAVWAGLRAISSSSREKKAD